MTRFIPCHTCGQIHPQEFNICHACLLDAYIARLSTWQLFKLIIKKASAPSVKDEAPAANNTITGV